MGENVLRRETGEIQPGSYRFFDDAAVEAELLQRLCRALDAAAEPMRLPADGAPARPPVDLVEVAGVRRRMQAPARSIRR